MPETRPVRDTGDNPSDCTTDVDGDERWVSFEELAKSRGVTKQSAIKLVRRHRWRRQRDNQGHVLACVPIAWLMPEVTREPYSTGDSPADRTADTTTWVAAEEIREPYSTGDSPADRTADISRITNAFEAGLAALREQLAVANRRAEQAEARVRELEIERLVEAAARRSWLFGRWRR
jgi:hypothetical protein